MILLLMFFRPIMCIDAFGIHGRFVSSANLLEGKVNNSSDLVIDSHIDMRIYYLQESISIQQIVASMHSWSCKFAADGI